MAALYNSSLFSLVFLLLIATAVAEIRSTQIRSDSRSTIPFDEFGYTHFGRLNLTVTGISFSNPKSGPEPVLSELGFFLVTREAWQHVLEQLQDGDIRCTLHSDLVKKVFTFDQLQPSARQFTTSFSVSDANQFTLVFANCMPNLVISMNVHSVMYNFNPKGGQLDFLSAGKTALPAIYYLFFVVYVLMGAFWVFALYKKRLSVYGIHFFMLAVVILKALNLLCEAEDKSYIKKTGTAHGWDVLFYIFSFLKGITLFTLIVLIGTGWSFLKPYLQDKEKKVLMIVIPLQVVANLAQVVIDETGPFGENSYTWKQVFLLVDIVCCCAVLFPIVWSIKNLREAAKTDGKAAVNLMKLTLFRQYYVIVICYIYFTRVVVYALETITSYRYQWTSVVAAEAATLAFYAFTGYNFRPKAHNPYFAIDDEDPPETKTPKSQCKKETITMASFMQNLARTKNIGKRSKKKYLEDALYKNLFKEGGEENHVRKNLNQFLKSHKSAFKWEVGKSLKVLRQRKLYASALKLSETLEKRGMNKTVSDQAIHIDIVAKSKGIEAGESYFLNLPETSKDLLTYCALLNCYCKELMTEKAEALMEKVKELNLSLSSMPYNSLMTLYTKTGHPEKIPAIIQEMKANDVMPDCYTYNVWMRALSSVNDISGVERVIDEMKRDGRVAEDWTTYSNLASIYADAGLTDKAVKALKELEKKNACRNITAYQFLITLYGRVGNLLEVYRVWRSLRLAFPRTANISYLNMIQVLVNLNDIPGAEKCFKEWESGCPTYDIRIANVLIGVYTKQSSLEKAEQLKERARRSGAKPNAKTWEIFMDYYLQNGDIKSAIDCVDQAVSIGRGDGSKWFPSSAIVTKFMSHFEQNKDVAGAEHFVEILKKAKDELGVDIFESLLRTYIASEKTSPIMRRRIKMENIELTDEGKRLLDAVSVE